MTERFYSPVIKYTTSTLKTLPGALLYFYETGTSTPKTTWTDPERATTSAHPVPALADGTFPPIFINGVYRVELKNAAGVTQPGWPVDDVGSPASGFPFQSWSSTYSYSEDDLVVYDGEFYQSLDDDNVGNTPSAATLFWKKKLFLDAPTAESYLNGNSDGTYTWRTIAQTKSDLSLPADTVADLALKAPLDSPALTGTPTVPTASANTNTTQAASTEYVQTELLDRVQFVDSIADLTALTGMADGQQFWVDAYVAGQGSGGGMFFWDSSSVVAEDLGIVFEADAGGTGRFIRSRTSSKEFCVDWFGSIRQGGDDTATVLAAYTAAALTTGYRLLFPAGEYRTATQFLINDLLKGTIHFDGCILRGAATSGLYDGIFKIENAFEFGITGRWKCITSRYANYSSGLRIVGEPGGTITPSTGVVTRGNIYGYSAEECKEGIWIGDYDNDVKLSEIVIHGYYSLFCPTAVRLGGTQTICTFVGGCLAANVNGNYSPTSSSSVIIEGGGLTVIGGKILCYGSSSPVVDLNPALSATYNNPYGIFKAVGVLIETEGPHLRVRNPREISSPTSNISSAGFVGCVGYCGAVASATSFFAATDSTYVGQITVDDACRFYGNNGASAKSAYNVDCSAAPNTRVYVGKSAFDPDSGFKSWHEGTLGGIIEHSNELVLNAAKTSGTINSGSESTVVFDSLSSTSGMATYRSMYNASTGEITVPTPAPKNMNVSVSLLLGGSVNGSIRLFNNTGAIGYGWGVAANGTANLNISVNNPVAGDVYVVRLQPASNVSFTSSTTNRLTITLST